MEARTSVEISSTLLSIDEITKWVAVPEAGGIDLFIGAVRNHAHKKKVTHLEFEAYEPMAIKEMQKVVDHALQTWDCRKVAIWHRVGHLNIGDIAVLVAVSADHRAATFKACEYCIDTLKLTVPIWKKEFFEDGSHWVSAYP